MKRLILTVFSAAALSLAALELDFTDSGKKIPEGFALRGKETKFTQEGLENTSLSAKEPSGFAAQKNDPGFFPDGAFEFEIEFKLLPEVLKKRTKGRFYLWDNKYHMTPNAPPGPKHCGFMVYLERSIKGFKCTIQLGLDGKKSVSVSAPCANAGNGKFHRLRFRFDPSGRHTFFWDNTEPVKLQTPAGKIGKSRIPAAIGDRAKALYAPLDGVVKRVTLKPAEALKFTPVSGIQKKYGSRRVFARREKNARMTAEFSNMTEKKLEGKVSFSLRALNLRGEADFSAAPKENGSVTFPVETNLMPGKYDEDLVFTDAAGKELGKGTLQFTIVPELTDFQPILAGEYLFEGDVMDQVRNAGITHVHNTVSPRSGSVTPEWISRTVENLDSHLEHGLLCDDTTRINQAFKDSPKHQLADRNGNPYPRESVDAAHPEVYRYAVDIPGATARAVGSHPAWDLIYTNNEQRDHARINFNDNTRKKLKAATGLADIPANAAQRLPTVYSANRKLPWNFVVSTQSDEFRFWNWFWREGDGWDKINGDQGRNTARLTGKKRFLSNFGPATRALPYLGIAGDVALVSTWTYCNPDPVILGQTTDELLALADGKKLIGAGNQGIWYRSKVAPAGQKVKNPPAWVARHKTAKYISPHPDMLLEGFWIAEMRKIEMFSTHGQGSWLRHLEGHSYHFTHPEVTGAIRKFNREVREPLGSALKHVDEVTPEVMILESFTNALYGGGHTWGGGRTWIADLHLALQWAHIQPGICYEEHLFRGDLDDGKVKVLFLPLLPVVSDKLLAKLKDLQKKGVILVGDETLNAALMPDLRIASVTRDPGNAEKSKKELQKAGLQIRKLLKGVITPCMDSPSQDLILRRRASGEIHYLFAVNDFRKYGNYVGQWKRVMEEGIPLSATFTAALPAGTAYDLVQHKVMPFQKKDGKLEFSIDLAPGDGKVIALFPRPVGMVKLTAPETLKPGEEFSVKAAVADQSGKVFQAFLPLELRLEHNETVLPGSGFYATNADGNFVLNDTAALNLPKGKALLRVRCLSSGIEATQEVTVL